MKNGYTICSNGFYCKKCELIFISLADVLIHDSEVHFKKTRSPKKVKDPIRLPDTQEREDIRRAIQEAKQRRFDL